MNAPLHPGNNCYSNKELIPIKWMAPEQLGLGKKDKRPYNNQTDVWSFGITVWEIYSTGDSPFAKEKRSEVKRIMESGARPVQPDICSDELYKEVMMKCWEYKPSKRPSISEICSNLEVIFHGASGGDEYYDDQYGMGELYDDTI
ncbi:hypothetical protein LSH36_812g00136 [Paralvinella palmiformis]|uniref:Protein kinase domain-containing protein n=1 Tax=Paralvinella palmiformis TaxID=53620 RepID=A0AAD9MSH8_9ANNE|nr:hypothetical protein LSH36_812g00136 [Paralvinella palmiformis]